MRSRKNLPYLLVLILALAVPEASLGRTVMPTLEDLTEKATLIVVARVEEIRTESSADANAASGVREIGWEKRVATARVLEVWKGAAGETIQFRASKTWVCDVSTAVEGETVVLFLTENPKGSKVMAIAYDGIGRLPVTSNFIRLYSNLLTKKTKKLLRLPEETFEHKVELSAFKQEVRQLGKGNARRAE